MKRIYVPTIGAEDWQRLLAEPEKHWKTGFSARALAFCWEQADGFPAEVAQVFADSGVVAFLQIQLLLAFPEHKVPLPGGRAASQNDLFVLAKDGNDQLVAVTVEGKVAERFGQDSVGEWLRSPSPGKILRLDFLKDRLGITGEVPSHIRYQLLHRTVSALIEAQRFAAPSAVMLVHSFSESGLWFDDYLAFLELLGVQTTKNTLVLLGNFKGINLYSAWVTGDARFLKA